MSMTIPPYGTQTINVVFEPTDIGTRTGSIAFTSNSPNSPHLIQLTGTGKNTIIDPPVDGEISYLTADGAILRDVGGNQVMLRSINWYGFEQLGLPMGAWTRPYRTKTVDGVVREGMLDEIKRLGFNSIRLLFSQDTTWPGYKPLAGVFNQWNSTYIDVALNPEIMNNLVDYAPQAVKDTIEILDLFVGWCQELKLRIIFDMHTLAPDDNNVLATNGKWYTTNTPSAAGSTGGNRREPRNEQQAIAAHVFLADRYKNMPIVCGFDLINEPHECTWDRDPLTGVVGFYERCGNAIHAVNPHVLIICEGVSERGMNSGTVDHTPVGSEGTIESQQGMYKWGVIWSGKLDEVARVANVPVTLTIPNKVVYSPHEYGSWMGGSGAGHQWFAPEQFVGAGYTGLPFPDNMFDVWRRQWGYLAEENIAPVWIGEWGSYFRVGGDPMGGGGSGSYGQNHYDWDIAWANKLADYCNTYSIGSAFWALNPGGDPDGLLEQQPAGVWHGAQQFKLDVLEPFLNGVVIPPAYRITVQGNQFMRNGSVFRLKSVSWFGAETDTMVPHAMWERNWKTMIADIADMGFNSIRLPFSRQGFSSLTALPPNQSGLAVHNADLVGKNVYQIFDMIIAECAAKNIYTILDHHRNNWDAQDGTPIRAGYDEAGWHALWGQMATRYGSNPWVIGCDIYNEPVNTAWGQWATWVEDCAEHIHTIAPNWLIFVQGAERDPALNGGDNYFWAGGNLEAVRTRPITLTRPNRVVYAPHEYAHSVYAADWLARDGFPNPVNWPNNLFAKRSYHYGFIFEDGIAPIWVGEFGGEFGYNGAGALNGDVNTANERAWLTNLTTHLNGDYDGNGTTNLLSPSMGMSFCYWSYNANSVDTGGLLTDNWNTRQTGKLTLLVPLMTFTGVFGGVPSTAILDSSNEAVLDDNNQIIEV